MASVAAFSPIHGIRMLPKRRFQFQVRALDTGDSRIGLAESSAAVDEKKNKKKEFGLVIDGLDSKPGVIDLDKAKRKVEAVGVAGDELELLYDDGYGSSTVKDYLYGARDVIKPDGGPPRWFCPVDCGPPVKDSPTLLFLPGLDGVGLGLMLHHKALGKAFEVRCLHIPVNDRTPFEGLVKTVEEALRAEHASHSNRPIYLVGDSFGGCLALAVAARSRDIDLVVILANPATSFRRSQLQPLFPILESWPDELHFALPYLLSFVMGDPVKMASVDIEPRRPPAAVLRELSDKLTGLLPCLSVMSDIIPKETLLWKLKLLDRAAAYANSRLHAVKAQVLVLASGNDKMLPSLEEADRLKASLQKCRVRIFKDNGHTILLEDGVCLMSVIKATCIYRRRQSRAHDYITDFLPPSKQEFKYALEKVLGAYRIAAGSVMFSTLEDGRIVRGLAGVPDEGPVLFVGYHMLLGLEMFSLVEHFLKERKIMVRGLAHPHLFSRQFESSESEMIDILKIFGAVPVTAANMFRLFSTKSHILLYPGGAREALHLKGEAYKLIWPEQPEFVRMAARFGATIVPFGAVGEDDLAELVIDYEDMMKIPILNDYIRESNRNAVKVRDIESAGEVANDQLFLPGLLPKIPGRLYYLFGKPIETKGREETLKQKEAARELYLHVKSQVEDQIAYLLRKREEDPFRGLVDRSIYQVLYAAPDQVPTFDP
uniref:AB hydrolase-1 domain-containing protein n=1 Tax=Kalanchoe fedtschenkoi TaxID=63787 RepID=A0A7N0UA87_KALFE